MKLICIFRGNKLLDSSTVFHPDFSKQFKLNVSTEKNVPFEELDAVMFDDEELSKYVNIGYYMPTRMVEITREAVKLLKLERIPVTRVEKVDWRNCSDSRIQQIFTPEEIIKIQENKNYYDSLGNEKFDIGFQFEWPHNIELKDVEVNTTQNNPIVVKEVTGVVLEDILDGEGE